MALSCAVYSAAWAQAPAPAAGSPDASAAPAAPAKPSGKPAKASAQSEAGEPRADTSNSAPALSPVAAPAPASPAAPASFPAPAAPAARKAATGRPGAGSGEKPPSKTDRLDLGVATVTGDREQPKVMYIVPWKRSDIGDLTGKPMNSLVDEILAPVDRDVFKREVVYYQAVQATASQNGAQPNAGQQGEK